MANERNMGIAKISIVLLEDLLKFPEDHHIIDINYDMYDKLNNEITCLIEGPTLPIKLEGQRTEEVKIVCERIKTTFEKW